MSGHPVKDFDVVREPWNKYELQDGTVIKTKTVVTRIAVKKIDDKQAQVTYDMQGLTAVLTDEQGPASNKVYTQEEVQKAIVKDDVRYTTMSEEWNEYVTDDGTRLRLKSTVSRIAKTSLFDKNGSPIYWVEQNQLAQVKPPRP